MSNLDKAKELYDRIHTAFLAYGDVPQDMLEDLKDLCDQFTDNELKQLDEEHVSGHHNV